MKKFLVIAVITAIMVFNGVTAFALIGTPSYHFESRSDSEFFRRNEPTFNFDGAIPPELWGLFDFVPPTVHTSKFGTNIILPDSGTVSHPPSGAAIPRPLPGFPDIWEGLVLMPNPYVAMPSAAPTPLGELQRNSDGSIGRLQIPAIGLNVRVFDGDELAAMRRGVGHIQDTSMWNSNIGIAGHNRGTNAYFGGLHSLNLGDVIIYITNSGERKYQVTFVGQIGYRDWSMLQHTSDNRITLITCVMNTPSRRLAVQAVEIR